MCYQVQDRSFVPWTFVWLSSEIREVWVLQTISQLISLYIQRVLYSVTRNRKFIYSLERCDGVYCVYLFLNIWRNYCCIDPKCNNHWINCNILIICWVGRCKTNADYINTYHVLILYAHCTHFISLAHSFSLALILSRSFTCCTNTPPAHNGSILDQQSTPI